MFGFLLEERNLEMRWKVKTMLESRRELVELALGTGTNMWELCRRFGVSRKTAYKWLQRYREEGVSGLGDQSRRPKSSPHRTSARVEEEVVQLRTEHPAWGGRKLRRRLEKRGVGEMRARGTTTEDVRRRGLWWVRA